MADETDRVNCAATQREAVQHASNTAIAEIDECGELPRSARAKFLATLWKLLNADDNALFTSFDLSLSLAAVERVWPIWSAEFNDDWPLRTARSAVSNQLQRGAKAADLHDEIGRLRSHLDGHFLLGERYFAAIYAGFAAWALARDVVTPNPLTARSGSELHLPPDRWEPAFLASLAEAGGATWEAVGDNERRRAYWEWYVRVATPQAARQAGMKGEWS